MLKKLAVGILLLVAVTYQAEARHRHHARPYVLVQAAVVGASVSAQIVGGRPSGCPYAFCGCGVSLHIFGKIISSLNLAANWLHFPRAEPAPGMVAVHPGHHHVLAIERVIDRNHVIAYDPNGGRHLTWLHARSIAGWTVVNPHGGNG